MRRAKKESGGSLDSLLDTMTNVVGILVILLTITQLGVSDAVKRISSGGGVQPEVIDEAQEELNRLEKLWADLKARLDALIGEEFEDPEKRLRELKEAIDDLKANVAVLMETEEAKKRKVELELLALKHEAEEKIKAQEEEANKLRTQILENEDELASLRAKLEGTPVQAPLPAKVINLPNPRPAPEDARPLTFLCREGRIMLADVEAIREPVWKRVNWIIQKRRLGRDQKAGIDGKILSEEFNKNPIRDPYPHFDFDVTMTIAGRVPKLVLKRRKDAGETVEDVKRTSSAYQRKILKTDPDEYYLQFLVWPDSFEVYLEARKISAGRGLLAGWQAQRTSGEYTIDLGGDLRVGPPPPPPKPKPRLKPDEEPPAPPKPKRPPPPVPVDVID